MIFEYQALNKQGEKLTDLIDAPTEMSARQKLRSKDLYVVKLNRHDDALIKTDTETKSTFLSAYNKLVQDISLRLSTKQVGIFSRQLATLLSAGMPLLTAITDIIDQIENKNFKRIVVDIKEKLAEGMSFSNCVARHKIVFSDMYVNMVRVGENLGSLDQVVERLSDIEEKKNELKGKVQSALYYPAFLTLFSGSIVVFLMTSFVPSLTRMLEEMGTEPPLPTKIIVGISDLLSSFTFLVPFGFILFASFYMFYRYANTPKGRLQIDDWKLKVPIFKTFYKKLIVLQFTQNLGILLNNKVDILKSFEIVKEIVGNKIVEDEIQEVANKVREGASIAKSLSKSVFLPKLVLGMISAGEASDQLDTMLIRIGNVYEKELDMTVAGFTGLIAPVILVIMGIAIAMIVIAMLLPIFEMNMMV